MYRDVISPIPTTMAAVSILPSRVPQATDREMEQWLEIKRAASETISKHGAAISHHHGVGMDHMRWLEHEKSALGVGMLRAA